MIECNYNKDEFYTNDQCPMRCDYCPVPNYEGICKYERRVDDTYKLTPKGCLLAAMLDSDFELNNRIFNDIWNRFADLMKKHGYVEEEE